MLSHLSNTAARLASGQSTPDFTKLAPIVNKDLLLLKVAITF